MTNEEKYRTAKERIKAFKKFCNSYTGCVGCPLIKNSLPINVSGCRFFWLEMEADYDKQIDYVESLDRIYEKTENDIAKAIVEFMKLKDENIVIVPKNDNKISSNHNYGIKDLTSKLGEVLAILKSSELHVF